MLNFFACALLGKLAARRNRSFGKRLIALCVSNETRAVLMGHTNGNITTDYAVPEVKELFDAVDKLMQADVHEATIIRPNKAKLIRKRKRYTSQQGPTAASSRKSYAAQKTNNHQGRLTY